MVRGLGLSVAIRARSASPAEMNRDPPAIQGTSREGQRSTEAPYLSHWRLHEGKMMKLSEMVYKSAKDLLMQKIELNASGCPQEKYSKAQHLERLNIMFPVTQQFDPDGMGRRIDTYMKGAKDKVARQVKTGQGEVNDKNITNQSIGEELEIVSLLKDANKCEAKLEQKQPFYGSKSRYYKTVANSGGKVRSEGTVGLEEKQDTCVACLQETDGLKITDAGVLVCNACLVMDEKNWNKEGKVEECLKEVARVEQNRALMNMDFDETSGGTGTKEKPKDKKAKKKKSKKDKKRKEKGKKKPKKKEGSSSEESESESELEKQLIKQMRMKAKMDKMKFKILQEKHGMSSRKKDEESDDTDMTSDSD